MAHLNRARHVHVPGHVRVSQGRGESRSGVDAKTVPMGQDRLTVHAGSRTCDTHILSPPATTAQAGRQATGHSGAGRLGGW
eukprot:scaffold109549_cov53-Phaeocystis_antarctica.AAC.2